MIAANIEPKSIENPIVSEDDQLLESKHEEQ